MLASTSSDDAKELASFARTKNLPFISYTASSPELSSVGMYPNFMRTVAPDGPLTQVTFCLSVFLSFLPFFFLSFIDATRVIQ